MQPITKQEVEEAMDARPTLATVREAIENLEYLTGRDMGWLLVGYEIARRRVERGENL